MMNGRELLEVRERLEKLEARIAELEKFAVLPMLTDVAESIAAGDLRPGGVIRVSRQKTEKPAV